MKKGLIIVISAIVIIGIAFVVYDKTSTNKPSNTKSISVQGGSNVSEQTSNESTAGIGNTQNITKNGNEQTANSNTKNTVAMSSANNTSDQINKSSETSNNKINSTTTTQASSSSNEGQSTKKSVGNDANNTKQLVYGDLIPGTDNISHNIFLKDGTIYPKSANGFFMVNKESKEPLVDGNVTIPAGTEYSEYSGYSSLFKYYIINPYKLNNGPYKTTQKLNAYNPADTNFNETANNLTAIAYMQGGVIVTTNSSGQTVYVSAKSIKKPITFEGATVQYFEANAIINTDNTVPVRGEPGELPTFDTIGNQITQKGLNVVAIAQVNNFTKIIFGANRGIFSDWIPTNDITIENYS